MLVSGNRGHINGRGRHFYRVCTLTLIFVMVFGNTVLAEGRQDSVEEVTVIKSSGSDAEENAEIRQDDREIFIEDNSVEEVAIEEKLDAVEETEEVIADQRYDVTDTVSGQTGDLTWTLSKNEENGYVLFVSGNGRMADYERNSYSKWDSYYDEDGKHQYMPVTDAPWGSYYGRIRRIEIGEGCTYIGKNAFCGLKGLSGELHLPDSLTSISDNAFAYCMGLSGNLKLPSGVKTIGSSFQNCIGLSGNLSIPNGVIEIGHDAFKDCSKLSGELLIPSSVKNIGASAFDGCKSFTGTLILPEGLESINDNCFKGCRGFSGKLLIPSSVHDIGWGAFRDCSGFSGELVLPSAVRSIGNGAFAFCSGFSGELVLPDSLIEIGSGAFYDDRRLNGSLKIPSGIEIIGKYAFCECSGLSGELVLPNNLRVIGASAFYNCNGLNGTLNIPSTVESIGEEAFFGCSGFNRDLVLPPNIKKIEKHSFEDCSGFSGELVLPQNLEIIEEYAFYGCKGFAGDLIVPVGVTEIRKHAFDLDNSGSGTRFGGTLILPSSLKGVEESAFSRCVFSQIIFNEGVESIGEKAFYRNKNSSMAYGELILPESLKTIGEDAFLNSGFESVYIPTQLTSFPVSAFDSEVFKRFEVNDLNPNYSSDNNGVLYNKDKSILLKYPRGKKSMFYSIPSSVYTLEKKSFSEANNLIRLSVHSGVSLPYAYTINKCKNLRYIIMSDIEAPISAHADALNDLPSDLKICVPEGAKGYDTKPWSDYRIIKGEYIKPTKIKLSKTDILIENSKSYVTYVSYSIEPTNANSKKVVAESSNSWVVSPSVTELNGKPVIRLYTGYNINGNAVITVATDDGFASETIDVTVLRKNSSGEEADDDPTIEKSYSVTFKDGGKIYEIQTVKSGSLAVRPAVDPENNGARFIGWGNGYSLWNFSTPVTYNLVLTAKYAKKTIEDKESTGSGLDSVADINEDNKIYLVVGQKYYIGERGFTSNNTKAATVDKNKGTITAKSASKGTAVISNGSTSYEVIIQKPRFSKYYKRMSLLVGRSEKLRLSGIGGEYSACYPISWQSSNEKVATVNDGVVTALAKGKVNIYAYVGGKKYTATVNIKDIYTTPSKLTSSSIININPLNEIKLKYDKRTFIPSGAKWNGISSNSLFEIKNNSGKVIGYRSNVVEIYTSGKVRAVGTGSITLKGTDKHSNTVTLKFNVIPVPSREVVYVNVGEHESITFPKVKGSSAKWFLDGKKVTSNGTLEIDNSGIVKGLKVGTTTVTCEYKGISFNTVVYVENPMLVTEGKLRPYENGYRLELNKQEVFDLKLKDVYQTIVWNSQKKEIAFIDENGVIYARNKGKTVISTKINGKKVKIAVFVT